MAFACFFAVLRKFKFILINLKQNNLLYIKRQKGRVEIVNGDFQDVTSIVNVINMFRLSMGAYANRRNNDLPFVNPP